MLAKDWISALEMEKHPEGGYFKEFYRSNDIFYKENLPERYCSERVFSTSIYYLLEKNDISKFHRLVSDEIWYFHDGSPIILHILTKKGEVFKKYLGLNPVNHEFPQLAVMKGDWFAAELLDKSSYALVSCAVTPGFDFRDFEFADREELIRSFPQSKDLILRLT